MKKIISYIICFVILLSFASCGKNDYIGIDKAKQAVVDDIGAAIEDVEFAANELVTDDNGDYYNMKFTKDGTEYSYKVDAVNGKIVEKNSNSPDNDDNSDSTMNNNNNNDQQNNTSDAGNASGGDIIGNDNTDNMGNTNDNSKSSASGTK